MVTRVVTDLANCVAVLSASYEYKYNMDASAYERLAGMMSVVSQRLGRTLDIQYILAGKLSIL